jgi:hypothetical protein
MNKNKAYNDYRNPTIDYNDLAGKVNLPVSIMQGFHEGRNYVTLKECLSPAPPAGAGVRLKGLSFRLVEMLRGSDPATVRRGERPSA